MLALVLDRTHACLLQGGAPPDVRLTAGTRPLQAVETFFRAEGMPLPSPPAGSRDRADGGRDFVFVVERFATPPGWSWHPLRDVSDSDAIWQLYVECILGGWEPPVRTVDVWSFGNRPEMASQLAHLVACGAKRVTMGWVPASRLSSIPLAYVGAINVITDGFGYPRLVLESLEVRELPLDEIDAATAAGEGEGDLTYEDWRESHEAYFQREAVRLGLKFDEKALMSVERFEVLHVVGRR